MSRQPRDPIEFFFRMTDVRADPDGHWYWEGSINSESGYGWLSVFGVSPVSVHRFAYELFCGEAAPTRQEGDIHHKCKVKHCVNPWHLEKLTRKEHIERHPRTACPKGHSYLDPANRYTRKDGSSYCRACEREKRSALKRPRSPELGGNHYRNRTVCKNGHPYTPENTYTRPDGTGRMCKECSRITSVERAKQQKEARRVAKIMDHGGNSMS